MAEIQDEQNKVIVAGDKLEVYLYELVRIFHEHDTAVIEAGISWRDKADLLSYMITRTGLAEVIDKDVIKKEIPRKLCEDCRQRDKRESLKRKFSEKGKCQICGIRIKNQTYIMDVYYIKLDLHPIHKSRS